MIALVESWWKEIDYLYGDCAWHRILDVWNQANNDMFALTRKHVLLSSDIQIAENIIKDLKKELVYARLQQN